MAAKKPKEPEQPKQDATATPQSLGAPKPAQTSAPKITKYPNGTIRRDN